MSLFDKIKESLLGSKKDEAPKKAESLYPSKTNIKREFVSFSSTYRIGILGHVINYEILKPLLSYKKKLEALGYDCEILVFDNKRENDPQVYLQSFNLSDLNKDGVPESLRTDRFAIRRFDLLLNIYFEPCPQLLFLSSQSNARCRVSPYLDHFTNCSDILIPMNDIFTIDALIENINKTLELKPYVRQEI